VGGVRGRRGNGRLENRGWSSKSETVLGGQYRATMEKKKKSLSTPIDMKA